MELPADFLSLGRGSVSKPNGKLLRDLCCSETLSL